MAATVRAIRRRCPGTGIEVLIADYKGSESALRSVLEAGPDVLNHNLETVERLTRKVRIAARYHRSLALLRRAGELHPEIPTKSGLMLGLGETEAEIDRGARRSARGRGLGCSRSASTSSPRQAISPVERWVTPAEFEAWAARARALGFREVAAGPLVRSSYHAEKLAGRLA